MTRILSRSLFKAIGIGMVVVGVSPAVAQAEEHGTFRGLAVLVNTKFQKIDASEGHPGGAVMIGEMDGVVFNDRRETWLDKARYQVVWKGDGTGHGECLKTFTMPDGRLFAKCVGHAVGDGWTGEVELVGGTGAYEGITGRGRYRLTNVSETVMWDVLEWDWAKP